MMTSGLKNWFSNLSFRWKAIVFIASVEGAFNVMFAIIVVSVMQNNLEEQFFKRAQITSQLFATSTANAVLATDIASLESFVEEVMRNEDLLYARVRDSSSVLAEGAKTPELLRRSFEPDTNLSAVKDNVFDTFAKIRVDDEDYGQVEIGLSTGLLGTTISLIQIKVIMIGVGEILFSALVSFLLGSFLVRRLVDLQEGSHRVAEGDFTYRINDDGHDELAETSKAFNNMASKVHKLIEALQQTNAGLDQKRMVAEQDLQLAQTRLIQASKMESLGTLSGGIAHEINTPVQFIGNNLHFLRSAFNDLGTLINSYENLAQAAKNENILNDERDAVLSVRDATDFDFLQTEVPTAAEQAIEGVSQITGIVAAMKEFSHTSQKEMKPTDINRLIERATTVSKGEWKNFAEVEFNLEPSQPNILGLEGELNQVLLNLIVNASQAIEESGRKDGKIGLSSSIHDGFIKIEVSDNGQGIPQDIQDRVFDPFFTTKAVGKGTGQGLTISYDIIVNKHKGAFAVNSESGKGTTFIIELPVAPDQ